MARDDGSGITRVATAVAQVGVCFDVAEAGDG